MKNIGLNIEDLFEISNTEIFNPDNLGVIKSVSIDSRNIPSNCLFVAIKGKKFDGHNFLKEAVKNGAKAIMINKKKYALADDIDIPIITVKDTLKALGELAKIWRDKYEGTVIGLTGSAGKTSTKEMLSAILSSKYNVNKTLANLNNHIGVPLTILSTKDKHNVLVAELGTNHFGEIEYTANILRPDYALITNIGDSHLEFFKDRKGVLKEKKNLYNTVNSKGKIFINNDDKLLSKISKDYKNVVTYGIENEADVKGEIIEYTEEGKPVVVLKYKNIKLKAELPVSGEKSAINFVAAAAIALNLGLSKKDILEGLKKIKQTSGRMNIIKLKDNIIIDDTYNANPSSMAASIRLMSKINNDLKKAIIIGDMFELGLNGPKYHKGLMKVIKESKIDEVYSIGPLMKNLYEALTKTKINSRYFNNRNLLKKFLIEKDFKGYVILFKGSRGMKMEEFLKTIEEK